MRDKPSSQRRKYFSRNPNAVPSSVSSPWNQELSLFREQRWSVQKPQELPLIFVHEHWWTLYLAVDRLDKIEIVAF